MSCPFSGIVNGLWYLTLALRGKSRASRSTVGPRVFVAGPGPTRPWQLVRRDPPGGSRADKIACSDRRYGRPAFRPMARQPTRRGGPAIPRLLPQTQAARAPPTSLMFRPNRVPLNAGAGRGRQCVPRPCSSWTEGPACHHRRRSAELREWGRRRKPWGAGQATGRLRASWGLDSRCKLAGTSAASLARGASNGCRRGSRPGSESGGRRSGAPGGGRPRPGARSSRRR